MACPIAQFGRGQAVFITWALSLHTTLRASWMFFKACHLAQFGRGQAVCLHKYQVRALEVSCNMILCVFSSPLRVDQQAPLCDLVIGSTDGACTWADQLSDFLWPLPEVLDYPAKFGPGLANVDLHQLSLSTLSLSLSLISVYWSLGHIYFLYPAPLPNLAEGRKFLNPLVVKFLEMCSFFIAHLSSSLSMDWRRPWQWKLVFYIFDVLPPSPIWQRAGSFHPLSLSLISVYWSLGHIFSLSCPCPLAQFGRGQEVFKPLGCQNSWDALLFHLSSLKLTVYGLEKTMTASSGVRGLLETLMLTQCGHPLWG